LVDHLSFQFIVNTTTSSNCIGHVGGKKKSVILIDGRSLSTDT
jgi:hypothetical protein